MSSDEPMTCASVVAHAAALEVCAVASQVRNCKVAGQRRAVADAPHAMKQFALYALINKPSRIYSE